MEAEERTKRERRESPLRRGESVAAAEQPVTRYMEGDVLGQLVLLRDFERRLGRRALLNAVNPRGEVRERLQFNAGPGACADPRLGAL